MVEEENLEALDFMLWMAGSKRAAALTFTNQSTVVRRANLVLSVFGSDIVRSPLGWHNRGSNDLLKMERAIHQQFRFRGRKCLRLHVPFWSHRVLRGRLPQGWTANPADPSHTCANPLELLRSHVVDACILTPTQLDDASEDLLRLELYQSRIDLTLFCPSSPAQSAPQGVTCGDLLTDGHLLALKLFEFLPRSCRQASRFWFQKLCARAAADAPPPPDSAGSDLNVAFLTPEMRRTITTPFRVDVSQPRAYRESLVILRENAHQSRVLELLDAIRPVLSQSAGAEVPLLC